MTIAEVLHKATEGEYHLYGSDGMDTDYGGATSAYAVWTRKDHASSFIIPVEQTFLDPDFWQALGWVLEWDHPVRTVHAVEHGRATIVTQAGAHGVSYCRRYAEVEPHIKTGIESPWGGKPLCLSPSG